MQKDTLTAEEKDYLTRLVHAGYSNVEILEGIKEDFLGGRTIEEVRKKYFGAPDPREPEEPKGSVDEKGAAMGGYSDRMDPNREVRADPEPDSEPEQNQASNQNPETEPDAENLDTEYPPAGQETGNMAYSEPSETQQLPEIPAPPDFVTVQQQISKTRQELETMREDMEVLKRKVLEMENALKARILEKPEKEGTGKPFAERVRSLVGTRKRNPNGFIIRLLSNPKFTTDQIVEIRLGVEAALDEKQIRSYARAEIPARQMREIRLLHEAQNKKRNEEIV